MQVGEKGGRRVACKVRSGLTPLASTPQDQKVAAVNKLLTKKRSRTSSRKGLSPSPT